MSHSTLLTPQGPEPITCIGLVPKVRAKHADVHSVLDLSRPDHATLYPLLCINILPPNENLIPPYDSAWQIAMNSNARNAKLATKPADMSLAESSGTKKLKIKIVSYSVWNDLQRHVVTVSDVIGGVFVVFQSVLWLGLG
jgi:hypothetical protein